MTFDPSTLIDSSAVLPEGYTQRTATLDDAAAAAHMMTQAYQEEGEDHLFTEADILRLWQFPYWDIRTDSQLFFNPQGELIASLAVLTHHNPTHPWLNWDMVHDDQWEQVLRVLIAWGEQRALPALERCQPEECFAPVTDCKAETPRQTALESLGYHVIRRFYRMSITLQEAPAAMALPGGISLRSFNYPADLESMAAAYDDIWQDHYGYVQRPLSEVTAMWKDRIEKNPRFDPTIWSLAINDATGEIAAIVLCDPKNETSPDHGHINIVGVRRAYRKQGLAQAMILHAFAEFWQRGQTTVSLGVDAGSPTGATRLYERVGMSVLHQYVRLQKDLRPGIERMKTGD